MSLSRALLNLSAHSLRRDYQSRPDSADPRILVIRRNRMGDMIYTLPLLHALRRRYPQAHLAVACDLPGAPIAQACPAVNRVIVLEPGWNPWQAAMKNAASLQDYDWVVAAKGGFHRRLAVLTRLTNAARRIGFEPSAGMASGYYTDPVALPENPHEEHQIETLLRLLQPLGVFETTEPTVDLSIRVPESSSEFAAKILAQPPFTNSLRFMLINLSSTVALKFNDEDFIALAHRILDSTDFVIGLVSAPVDQPKAARLATRMTRDRVSTVATPGPMDLAALTKRATFLFTPEGGAAHLAATVGTPTLVLWSEGPFKKWYSRGEDHAFVQAESGETTVSLERVWQALQPFLSLPAKAGAF